MRSSLAFLLVTALSACSGGGQTHSTPDASDAPDGGLVPPDRGFQIVTPSVKVPPGGEISYCYYFRTPNTSDLAIKRWASHMTPGGHHLVTYLTSSEDPAPGTVTDKPCGFGAAVSGFKAVWAYSAYGADAEQTLPTDDGSGTPVGQLVKAGQVGFLQMHYVNASDKELQAHVVLNAYAYDEGVTAMLAAPLVAYNTDINLGPGSTEVPTKGQVSGSCDVVPIDGKVPKFFAMTTHVHKQGVHTFIKDGDTMLFESTTWDHPGQASWTAPFYTFSTGKLTYQCEYANPNNRTILTGTSAETDETCMAISYFFPAPEGIGHFCLNDAQVY